MVQHVNRRMNEIKKFKKMNNHHISSDNNNRKPLWLSVSSTEIENIV